MAFGAGVLVELWLSLDRTRVATLSIVAGAVAGVVLVLVLFMAERRFGRRNPRGLQLWLIPLVLVFPIVGEFVEDPLWTAGVTALAATFMPTAVWVSRNADPPNGHEQR